MKKEDLFDAVTEIDDRHIDHAAKHRFRNPFVWKQLAALAACGVLVIGLVRFIPMGGSGDAAASAPAASAPGAAPFDSDRPFDVFSPPVLPLFVAGEGTEALERTRTLTFDYSAVDDYTGLYLSTAGVSDSYVLVNPTDGDILAMVSYPSGGALYEDLPDLTVDGLPVETTVTVSDPLTTISADGWNLAAPQSVEPYAAYLNDQIAGKVSEPTPTLDEPVTVYTFTDAKGSAEHAATLQYTFSCAPTATTVLSYGFNGWSEISDTVQAYDFFINEHTAPETRALVVLGEDILNGKLQGYQNGACREGEELDGLTARITRTETTLGEALRRLAADHWARAQSMEAPATPHAADEGVTFDLYFDAVCRYFETFGPLNKNNILRYEDGRLFELMHDVFVVDRVRWQTAEIVIPAGESRTIEASYPCRGSFNYPGTGNPDDRYGYSLLTIADAAWPTTLRFTGTDPVDASGLLTTTEGALDSFKVVDGLGIELAPTTGYHAFTLYQ